MVLAKRPLHRTIELLLEELGPHLRKQGNNFSEPMCVCDKIVLFYNFTIFISLYIQYGCMFRAKSALVAKCSYLIGQIGLFGSKKSTIYCLK